ncbi:uncharacterized protein LOC126654888 [Mercurialis annua]|uniref:uncharacterized protein LOC126654888 n=1 Tax=Mercurialis annua TaxID=3986 RepID=UPI00215F5804|nr:uncharacterized protein LOC126654888 [Mercurialis annua]
MSHSLAKDPSISKSNRYRNFILLSSSVCIIYLLVSVFLVGVSKVSPANSFVDNGINAPTKLAHIVFGIASSEKLWPTRKDYVNIWWKHPEIRGCVFLDSLPPQDNDTSSTSFPPTCISEDTSGFRYTFRKGFRSAIRVARVVSETVKLNHSDVRWYVFGDDDTVFFPENLVKTLSKYDHELWYYIGSNSEIYEQNRIFGFEMAYGGAGFAISYSLANVLAKVFDSCIQRYPHLYGSDSRVSSCLAELGVGVTREPGFHQVDIRGDMFGLLTSHPLSPLVSLHHLEYMDPIFPNMTTVASIEHLFKAATIDSQRIVQKTVCYDRWYSWTISVAWGYAVEVYENHIFLPDTLPVQTTFKQWKKGSILSATYNFNIRQPHPDICRRPAIFFLDRISSSEDRSTSHYKQVHVNCSYDMASPRKLEVIKVFSHKLHLTDKQLRAPRRQCCDILPSSGNKVMEIEVRECKEDELIHIHP